MGAVFHPISQMVQPTTEDGNPYLDKADIEYLHIFKSRTSTRMRYEGQTLR